MKINHSKPLPTFSPEDADFEAFHWSVNKGYGYRWNLPRGATGRKHVWAHRVVLERVLGRELKYGEICDHVNGDRLDNRRENLRLTDIAGNSQNVRATGISGIRGVKFHKRAKKWQARVKHKGKEYYCGLYLTAEDAGRAAAAKRSELGFLGGASAR